mgnify:CR=1 FL=1
MKLVGFMKNGKGTLHEPGELFAASGSIEVVKEMDGGITVIQVTLGDKGEKSRKPYKKRDTHSEPTSTGEGVA